MELIPELKLKGYKSYYLSLKTKSRRNGFKI